MGLGAFIMKKDWQWYRDLFHISIFRYLVVWFSLVPIAARFINKIPDTIDVDLEVAQFTFVMELPFTWELLWVSSLFFVLAYLTYFFFRPEFLMKYSSYGDYRKHEHSPRWIAYEAKNIVSDKNQLPNFFERIKTKKYIKSVSKFPSSVDLEKGKNVIVEEKHTSLYFLRGTNRFCLSMPIIDEHGDEDADSTFVAERELFWEIFGRFSTSRKVARVTISLLLLASGLSFLLVLLQNIYYGMRYLFFA